MVLKQIKTVDEAASDLVIALREGQLNGPGIDEAFFDNFFSVVELSSAEKAVEKYVTIQKMHMEVRLSYDPNVCNQEGYAQRVEALLE